MEEQAPHNSHSFDYNGWMRTWGTGSIIYPEIKMLDMIMASLIVLLTTCIAALYLAVKAARIKPLEALYFV